MQVQRVHPVPEHARRKDRAFRPWMATLQVRPATTLLQAAPLGSDVEEDGFVFALQVDVEHVGW